MRLIHNIPGYQDIAIWYDEFLVPGEAWSKVIAEALEKSGLVTIAITKHITEEPNYINDNEYPDAKKKGKKIVPAKLSEAETKKLSELFPGLPKLVDGKNEEEIAKAISGIELKENDHDPLHNFLIGMAYLNGIDVERDNNRAVELITGAAEANLPEAIEKLVAMYQNGEGVEANEKQTISWQMKLVDLYRQEYQYKQTEYSAKTFIIALFDLLKRTRAARMYDETKYAAEEMIKLCNFWLDHATGLGWFRRYLTLSYENLGNIDKTLGDPQSAKILYEKTLDITEPLVNDVGTNQTFDDFAIANYKLWSVDKSGGTTNLEKAVAIYKERISIRYSILILLYLYCMI